MVPERPPCVKYVELGLNPYYASGHRISIQPSSFAFRIMRPFVVGARGALGRRSRSHTLAGHCRLAMRC
jgi:hypothetical protein